MIFWISGVESRALSIGKGLESVAALVSDFDENLLSFVEILLQVDFCKNSSKFLFFLSLSNRIQWI